MSGTPGTANLVVRRGATWKTMFTYKTKDGVAIDLTGYQARAQVRERPDSPGDPILELLSTGGSPRITITPADGKVVINVSSADTPLLSPQNVQRELVYDIELYDDSVSPVYVIAFVRGALTVLPEVTR